MRHRERTCNRAAELPFGTELESMSDSEAILCALSSRTARREFCAFPCTVVNSTSPHMVVAQHARDLPSTIFVLPR